MYFSSVSQKQAEDDVQNTSNNKESSDVALTDFLSELSTSLGDNENELNAQEEPKMSARGPKNETDAHQKLLNRTESRKALADFVHKRSTILPDSLAPLDVPAEFANEAKQQDDHGIKVIKGEAHIVYSANLKFYFFLGNFTSKWSWTIWCHSAGIEAQVPYKSKIWIFNRGTGFKKMY